MSSWNERSNQTHAGSGPEDASPRGRAAETVARTTGRQPGELAAEIGEVVRRNCVPLALIGAGAVWLATSQARGRHADDDLRDAASAAGNAGQQATAYARNAGSAARAKAAGVRDRVRSEAPDGGTAREKAQGAMAGMRGVYHRNPLLVGVLTAGGTAALAAAIAIRRNGGNVVSETQQQAKAAGQHAADRTREEAEKARTVAERTAQATRDTAREVAAEEAKREGLAGAEHLSRERSGDAGGTSPGNGSGTGRSS